MFVVAATRPPLNAPHAHAQPIRQIRVAAQLALGLAADPAKIDPGTLGERLQRIPRLRTGRHSEQIGRRPAATNHELGQLDQRALPAYARPVWPGSAPPARRDRRPRAGSPS